MNLYQVFGFSITRFLLVLNLDDGREKSFQEFFAVRRVFVEETGGKFDEQTLSFEIMAWTRFEQQVAHCNGATSTYKNDNILNSNESSTCLNAFLRIST